MGKSHIFVYLLREKQHKNIQLRYHEVKVFESNIMLFQYMDNLSNEAFTYV